MKPLTQQIRNTKTKPNANANHSFKTSPISQTAKYKGKAPDVEKEAVSPRIIPETGTGTIDISENGLYDVKKYAVADVKVKGGGEKYEGDYIVTPSAHNDIILETADKVMEDNVTVLEIPYYETSNITGTTVYIADQI